MLDLVKVFTEKFGIPEGLEWVEEVQYFLPESIDDLKFFLEENDSKLFERVGLDTETSSLDYRNCRLAGISLSPTAGVSCYIPLDHDSYEKNLDPDEVKVVLKEYLKDRIPVAYNMKFDLLVLKYKNFPYFKNMEDAMIAVFLENVSDKSFTEGLKAMASKLLGIQMIEFEEVSADSFTETDPRISGLYAAADADMALRILGLFPRWITKDEKGKTPFIWRLENAVVHALVKMEENALLIDRDRVKLHIRDAWNDVKILKKMIYENVGFEFDIASPQQVAKVVYDTLGVEPTRFTAGGKPATSKAALSEIAEKHPVALWIEACRILEKNVLGGYDAKLLMYSEDVSQEARFNFNSVLAPTGRLSSDSGGKGSGNVPINGQNIPSTDAFEKFTAKRILNKEDFLEFFGVPEEEPPYEELVDHVRAVQRKRKKTRKPKGKGDLDGDKVLFK